MILEIQGQGVDLGWALVRISWWMVAGSTLVEAHVRGRVCISKQEPRERLR